MIGKGQHCSLRNACGVLVLVVHKNSTRGPVCGFKLTSCYKGLLLSYQAIPFIQEVATYSKLNINHQIDLLKMCKGMEEKKRGGFCRRFPPEEEVASFGATRGSSSTSCELCGLRASLYCQADDAYLCRKCDKWVHRANFLALRHVRCFLCNTCQNLTRRYLIGASLEVLLPPTIENLPNNSSTTGNCSRTQNSPFQFL